MSAVHRWSQVASGDLWRPQMVSAVHRWSQVVSGGLCCPQAVSGICRWSQVASGGLWHLQVVPGGLRRWLCCPRLPSLALSGQPVLLFALLRSCQSHRARPSI